MPLAVGRGLTLDGRYVVYSSIASKPFSHITLTVFVVRCRFLAFFTQFSSSLLRKMSTFKMQ